MKRFQMTLTAICLVLLTLLSLTSCKEATEGTKEATATATDAATAEVSSLWDEASYKEDTTLGEGGKTVRVKVEADGKSITFTLKTDKATLAEAMQEHGLLEGEEGQYGLYVKKVNGILADYDVDQTYWSFTKNGEMMMVGVSGAEIADGESYELVRTK